MDIVNGKPLNADGRMPNTVNNAPTSTLPLLILTDDAERAQFIKMHLPAKGIPYKVAQTSKEAQNIVRSTYPQIIMVAAENITTSEELLQLALQDTSRTYQCQKIVFIHSKETAQAFKSLKLKTFDDYQVINPLYDKFCIQATLYKALQKIKSHKNSEKLNRISANLQRLAQISEQHQLNTEGAFSNATEAQNKVFQRLETKVEEYTEQVNQIIAPAAPTKNPNSASKLQKISQNLKSEAHHAADQSQSILKTVKQEVSQDVDELVENVEKLVAINSHKNILVIEDDSIYQTILQKLLIEQGFEVKLASTGKEGLLKMHESPPDLIILDWSLPDISGLEVLKAKQNHIQTATTPTIILTGHGHNEVVKQAIKAGAHDFMVKPAESEVLFKKMYKLLFKERQ
jgi:DNA-binding response OmpR family regulator